MITAARLRKLLDYDQYTGLWVCRCCRTPVGRRRKTDQRFMVSIKGRAYFGSVLAVVWMTGRWPTRDVDHKDGDPTNDRWANLQQLTRRQNLQKMKRRKDNTSGFIGVCRRTNGRFLAYIRNRKGRRLYLGHYPTAESAARVRDEAALKAQGPLVTLNFPHG